MLVLLDRDGVLNEDLPKGVLALEQLVLLPGVKEALALLKRNGFRLAVVSNQSCVGRGWITEEALEAIHRHLQRLLGPESQLDRIYACTDAPEHASDCRKPRAGMLYEALADFKAVAARTPMVGDALRDLQAAASAGCPRILLRTGKGEATLRAGLPNEIAPVVIMRDMTEAADYILREFGKPPVH